VGKGYDAMDAGRIAFAYDIVKSIYQVGAAVQLDIFFKYMRFELYRDRFEFVSDFFET
jgi:hypothetical protein